MKEQKFEFSYQVFLKICIGKTNLTTSPDFQERLMFRIAAAYTRATEFHKQRPAIYASAKLGG